VPRLLPLAATLLSAAIPSTPARVAEGGASEAEASASAGPLRPEQIPDALKGWTAWALRGHEAALCPLLSGAAGADSGDSDEGESAAATTRCLWPGRLELQLDARGGRFTQTVQVFHEGFVDLPGDGTRWPQDVRADGGPAAVIGRDDRPALFLKAGEHAMSGAFAWKEMPESLPVPPQTGLVALTLRGRAVPFPNREADGLLWLQREQEPGEAESRLEVKVHRKVQDGVPLLLVTRMELQVSGKNREVQLGRALPAGFLPLSLESPLPARVEPDGRVRVQLRAGSWSVGLIARSQGPVKELPLAQDAGGPWAAEEVWAWQAAPDLRAVEVEGVPSVDATQTTLPRDWQKLPAFRVRPGEAMKLVERRRGDSDPAPDQLVLQRTIWLDFDGRGATLRDGISGKLTRAFRLDMPAPVQLGRVAVGGKDQLITQLAPGAAAGVEVRSGVISLLAESRVEEGVGSLPATGWAHEFRKVSAELNLPPGWRLLHASGVDDASPTWIARWSLLDLFLVLIAALACGRLFGWGWGALAFAALALAVPEGAPKWAWLFPLAAEALLRVVPEGRARLVLQAARGGVLVVLVILLVPFAVEHVRGGIYPALEQRGLYEPSAFGESALMRRKARFEALVPAPGEEAVVDRLALPPPAAPHMPLAKKEGLLGALGGRDAYQQKLDLTQIDPFAAVQSGPGLPQWSWDSVSLRWSGPVEQGTRLRLWLLPPWAGLILAFARVFLLALLLLRLLAPRGGGLRGIASLLPARSAAAVFFAFQLALPAHAAGELPSPELIEKLRAGLTAPPACHPDCAASPRLLVEASASTLRLRQEITAAANVGVPLPGGLSHWSPGRVLLDGQSAKALRREADGNLWIELSSGSHQILLEGPLPPRDSVQIPLPLRPRHVEAKAEGWTVSGLHDDGTAEENLQLSRAQRASTREKLQPGQLPPFLEVERALLLGLTWQVETQVSRRSPEGAPVVIEVPLLPGESVISADVRAEKGKALVSLGPRTSSVSWRSTLTETPRLSLSAPRETAWVEVWRLEAAPVWHVQARGIPAVHQEPTPQRVPVWRPWPGEQLTLEVSRPAPVPGRTLTLRKSALTATPGARSTDVRLELELASSRGQPHVVELPEGSVLQSVQFDGRALPLRPEGSKVTLALPPGQHQISLDWREPHGVSFLTRMPRPDLGAPSVNATETLQLGRRWVLLAGGPRLGPAVLFWSFAIVMVLVGVGLARLGLAPLRAHQWVLLALGLSQANVIAAALVVGWLFALGARRGRGAALAPRAFDLVQILLVLWTLASAVVLFAAIERGLLGDPEMQVAGNDSSASSLIWFADRTEGRLPQAFVLSAPMFVYRAAMLAWALWLASSLVRWLPWAWGGFSAGGLWKKRRGVTAPEPSPAVPPPPASPATPG
jgi:hypothetical protein